MEKATARLPSRTAPWHFGHTEPIFADSKSAKALRRQAMHTIFFSSYQAPFRRPMCGTGDFSAIVCIWPIFAFYTIPFLFSRRKVIRTRLKRHNFGIFRLVVFERRQPFGILRTKILAQNRSSNYFFSANRFKVLPFIYTLCHEKFKKSIPNLKITSDFKSGLNCFLFVLFVLGAVSSKRSSKAKNR